MPRVFGLQVDSKTVSSATNPTSGNHPRRPPSLTRSQVAARLGVGLTTVRRLEKTRRLHPKRGKRGFLFRVEDVDRLRATYPRHMRPIQEATPGEIAARAFELFEQGKGLRDVVISLRQSPEAVRELYRQYALSGDLIVPAEIRQQIERFGFGGENYSLKAADIPRFFHNLLALIDRLRAESLHVADIRQPEGG